MTKRYFDVEESSKRLKLLMKDKGLTQEQLANRIGVSRKSINQYCTGKAVPDEYNRKLLCDLFNVSEDYLLGVGEYKNTFDKADKNMSSDLPFTVELYHRFSKNFNFDFWLYSDKKLEELDKDIREYIKFKIESFKKDNS